MTYRKGSMSILKLRTAHAWSARATACNYWIDLVFSILIVFLLFLCEGSIKRPLVHPFPRLSFGWINAEVCDANIILMHFLSSTQSNHASSPADQHRWLLYNVITTLQHSAQFCLRFWEGARFFIKAQKEAWTSSKVVLICPSKKQSKKSVKT